MICISIGNIELLRNVNALLPEMLEIRYDLIDETPADIDKILDKNIRQIATCRPGKHSDNQRINILKSAIDFGSSFIDVEIESDDEYITELLTYAEDRDCDLILSYHNFDSTPGLDELKNILSKCYQKGGQIAKIACMVNNSKDNARLLSLYELTGRKVVLGMGDLGKITRYAAIDLGAEFTFVSIDSGTLTAPGQMTYDDFQSVKKIMNKI